MSWVGVLTSTRAQRTVTRPDPARPQSSILGAAESRRRSARKVMRGCRGANALGVAGFRDAGCRGANALIAAEYRRRGTRKVMRDAAERTRSARWSIVGVVTAK